MLRIKQFLFSKLNIYTYVRGSCYGAPDMAFIKLTAVSLHENAKRTTCYLLKFDEVLIGADYIAVLHEHLLHCAADV